VELLILFLGSFGVGLSGAMMPGPMLTMAIAETARRGFRTGPLLVLGHGIVEAVVVAGLVLGLSQLIQHVAVKGTVALLGGLVLAWMGYGMSRAAWSGSMSVAAAAGASRGPGPIPAGALISVSNPYWLLWWATVGAAYVATSLQHGPLGLASFFGGHILADLAWFSLVALLVVSGRRILSDRLYRGLIFVCAAFLVALGLWFVASGVAFLRG
jgi:threonine/homoserine/homoserine lactone efflux protein